MIYVVRNGVVVPKSSVREPPPPRGDFPTPRLSRMEPYESPIDGKEVTSWAQRDRELRDNDCYDPRDQKKTPDGRRSKPTQLDLFAPTGDDL